MSLWFVSATRLSETAFDRESALARSLARVAEFSPFVLAAAYENSRPLPEIFNRAIDAAGADDTIVFVHDDVWIDDWYVAHRLEDALAAFDVVGVAGNRRRLPKQQSWAFAGGTRREHFDNLSGGIFHGPPERAVPSRFGPTPLEVKLMDGVFIAARARTLRERGVRFDPRFSFHFYDTDFCRSCERAGLRMGTWPIALTHRSAGENWAGPAWDDAYRAYLEKWGE